MTPKQRSRRTKVRYTVAALIPVATAWLTNLKPEGFQNVLDLTATGKYELVFILLTLLGAWANAVGALHNKDCHVPTDMQMQTPGVKVPA